MNQLFSIFIVALVGSACVLTVDAQDAATTTLMTMTSSIEANQCPNCITSGNVLDWPATSASYWNPGSSGKCPIRMIRLSRFITSKMICCCLTTTTTPTITTTETTTTTPTSTTTPTTTTTETTTTTIEATTQDPNQCPPCQFLGTVVNWLQLLFNYENPGLSGTCPSGTNMEQKHLILLGWKCCCDDSPCDETTTSISTTKTTEKPTTKIPETTTTTKVTTQDPHQCPPCLFSGTIVNWIQLIADFDNPGLIGTCPSGTDTEQEYLIFLGWKCCCNDLPCE